MERLRLGMAVLLRVDVDKGRAVLGTPAMLAAWGFGEGSEAQRDRAQRAGGRRARTGARHAGGEA